jgi:hypothetical protein
VAAFVALALKDLVLFPFIKEADTVEFLVLLAFYEAIFSSLTSVGSSGAAFSSELVPF